MSGTLSAIHRKTNHTCVYKFDFIVTTDRRGRIHARGGPSFTKKKKK